jgi:hypothetical protein
VSNKYRAEQYITISPSEAGEEIELLMVVTFKVHKGFLASLTEPGEETSAEIDDILFFKEVNGKPSANPVSLPSWIIGSITDTSQFKDWLLSEANDNDEMALCDLADMKRKEQA